jgi:hypothetical protein
MMAPVHAQTTTYDFRFGTLVLGSVNASAPFAWLSVSTEDHLSFAYHLTLGDLDTLFNPGAYVSGLLVNSVYDVDPISATIAPGSWGVDRVFLANQLSTVGGVAWDFGEFLCSGCVSNPSPANRLTANEQVMWTTIFGSPQPPPFFDVPPLLLKVNGLGSAGVLMSGFTPLSPVPEPQTYAMLLAGLGLLGWQAQRRRNKESAPA